MIAYWRYLVVEYWQWALQCKKLIRVEIDLGPLKRPLPKTFTRKTFDAVMARKSAGLWARGRTLRLIRGERFGWINKEDRKWIEENRTQYEKAKKQLASAYKSQTMRLAELGNRPGKGHPIPRIYAGEQ